MKITVLGDIMCEPSVLKAAKKADGTYNFDKMYEKVRPMIDEADYVIGNMELALAGKAAVYSDSFVSFNAPDSFAESIKNAGIDLISTVNNHTFDRGLDGMLRTNRVLDEIGLPYTGTFSPDKGRQEAYYFELNGVKFAVIAYTYSTNKELPESQKEYHSYINRLRPRAHGTYTP